MKNITSYLVLTLSIFLTACGGGNSPSTTDNDPSEPPSSKITGFVSKGPVSGATCTVYNVNKGVAESKALGVAVSSAGTIEFAALADSLGTVLISCTGGTYTDEATGKTDVAAPNMNAVVTLSPKGHYVISPLTELAYRLSGADLETAITVNNKKVAEQFGLTGIDITSEQPTDLNESSAGDNHAGSYGAILAAISQLVDDQSEGENLDVILTALAVDLADGTIDEATQENIASALDNFASGASVAGGNVNNDVNNELIANLVAKPSLNDIGAKNYINGSQISTFSLINNGGGILSSCTVAPSLPTGLTITVSDDKTTCEISGTPTANQLVKTYTIEATNAAGSDIADMTISVTQAPIIKVGQPPLVSGADLSKAYGDAAFTQTATGGAGSGATTYSSDALNIATVNSSTGEVTIIGVGSATITASKAGDTYHTGPVSDSYVVTVVKGSMPNISISNVTKNLVDSDFEPTATGGNGTGTIVATASSSTSVATIIGGQVHIVAAGTTTITAHEQGDINYNNSADTTFVLSVNAVPVANAGADQSKTIGQTASLDGSASSDDGSIVSYVWSFAGNNIGTGATLNVQTGTGLGQFPVGVHTITLTVTDNLGITNADTMTLNVLPLAPTNLTGTIGNAEALLNWDVVAGANNYNVYLATETFGGDISNYASLANGTLIPNINSNTYTVTGLTNSVIFYFVVTSVTNGVESLVSNEVTVVPVLPERDQWLNSATSAVSETSAYLSNINSAYSSQSYAYSGARLTESKYAIGHYNTSDTNADSKIFIYNPLTKTSLIEVNAGGITRPLVLMGFDGYPIVHNNKAIIVSGHPYGGWTGVASRKIGLLDIANNTITTSTIPSADLNGGSLYAMGDKGFIEGDTVYMTMHYKDYVATPDVWIIKWNLLTNTFTHLALKNAVNAAGFTGALDDRAQFVAKGKSGHILIGLYASNVFHILEINEASGQVTNTVNVNTQTGDAGYYDAINYKGSLYAVPRSNVGSVGAAMKILKINIANFTHQVISIDEGVNKNTARQNSGYSSGFSQVPNGETGLFVPRYAYITGNSPAKQYTMMLDLDTPRFYFVSLNASNFQQSLSDNLNDQILFSGISPQKNGQIISNTFWKDVSATCYNNYCLRQGAGVYHAKGVEINVGP